MIEFPRVLEVLSGAWDTSGGQSLRAVLWSVYNDSVAVPMWSAFTDFDDRLREEVCGLLVLGMDRRAAVIEGLLHASGEWERVDAVPLKWASSPQA